MTSLVQIASDNFTRPNEAPLGSANWTNFSVGTGLAVVNNLCVGRDITGDAELYTGVTLSANQYAATTVGQFGISSEINLYTRSDMLGLGGYQAFFFGNGVGGFSINLFGAFGSMGLFVLNQSPQVGDTMLLASVGNTHSVFYNGTKVISAVDSVFTSGISGLGIKFSAAQPDTSVSLFTTGQAMTSNSQTGVYEGTSLSKTFTNPSGLDLIQVVNEGGKVVWNLTSTGVANTNPIQATGQALLSRYEGSSFANAFSNLAGNDILQIINPISGTIVFGVSAQGTSYTTPIMTF
jgi:hypothetical protein